MRERHGEREHAKKLRTLEEARARRVPIDWSAYTPPAPKQPGIQVFEDYPLSELRDRIDWTPFFRTWELSGTYPAIFDDETVGPQARELFGDAQQLLERLLAERRLRARGVIGLFPANAVGDDVVLYADDRRQRVLAVAHQLRQQVVKPKDRPDLCLADFVAPRDTGLADWFGAFAVTAGLGLDAIVAEFEAAHDDYNAILAKALADRLAEAFAERLHERVRQEFWGYATDERLDNQALIAEKYRGIRPAPGYPACPDHTEKRTLFALLDAEARAEMTLTESCAMLPAASVSGWYLAHPDAFYFGVGKITRDQVEDYARRKDMTVEDVERWLAPNLAYDPRVPEPVP